MNKTTKNRTTTIGVLALGLLVATLLATLLSSASAGADVVPAGNARSWGDNYFGQLGNGSGGTDTGRNIPGAVRYIDGVESTKAGCAHGLALKTDGTVRSWGDNSYGQLGDAAVGIDSNVPVETYGLVNVKAISAGCNHNLALKEKGSVWAWGDNEYGQLGNGEALPGASRAVPFKVANLSGVKAIATDGFARHALALKQDGTVRTWGDDFSGQLGNGGFLPGVDKALPVQVKNLSGVKAVSAGGFHSLALLESGRVRSWGANLDGQLGNDRSGIDAGRSTPGGVSGLDNVGAISGGAYHSLAVMQSGRARAWGDNEYGQLGNGTSGPGTDSDVPVAVKNLLSVKNLDGGYEFSLAAVQ